MNESALNLQAARLRNKTKTLIDNNINAYRDVSDLKRDIDRYGAFQVRGFQGTTSDIFAVVGQAGGGTTAG